MVDNDISKLRSNYYRDLEIKGALRRHTTTSYAAADDDQGLGEIKEQERLLPIANVGRIMKQILPPTAKISKEGKETMQECASEFISFVTGEASAKCSKEKRKTVNGDDICWALASLGFDEYSEALKRYLIKYRDSEGDKLNLNKAADYDEQDQDQDLDQDQSPLGFGLNLYGKQI